MGEITTGHDSRNRLRSKKEQGGSVTVKGEGPGAGTDATDREAVSSALGSGKAAKGGGSDMPKQSDFGGDFAAYTRAMGAWRRKKTSGATMNDAGAALSKRLN